MSNQQIVVENPCRTCGRNDTLVKQDMPIPDVVINGESFVCSRCMDERTSLRRHIVYSKVYHEKYTNQFGVFVMKGNFDKDNRFLSNTWEGPMNDELFPTIEAASASLDKINAGDNKNTYCVMRQMFEITNVVKVQRI